MTDLSGRVCTSCGTWRDRSHFHLADPATGRLRSECKGCIKAKRKAHYAANAQRMRDEKRLARHGITPADFARIIDAQDGLCAICGSDNGGDTFHVDHDHRCCPGAHSCGDCIRGVLCNRCSVGLGSLGDQIDTVQQALGYLLRWERRRLRESA